MFDVIVGILYVAVITGLAFAKFARPRPRVLFSDRALIVDYEGGNKALVFRVANGRSTQIVNANVPCADFSVRHEPPYTEPYVRWCGRTAGAIPPPTRCRRH